MFPPMAKCEEKAKRYLTWRSVAYLVIFAFLLWGSIAACFVDESPWDGTDQATVDYTTTNTTITVTDCTNLTTLTTDYIANYINNYTNYTSNYTTYYTTNYTTNYITNCTTYTIINSETSPTVHLGTEAIDQGDSAWMLAATALVLLMTPGLAFFYGGLVGGRSIVSTLLQNVICMGVIGVLWVVIGFGLAFGEDAGHFYGNPATYWMFHNVGGSVNADLAPTIPLALFMIFQCMFAVITPAIITGAFAERVRFPGFLVFIILWNLAVYCPLAHWTWHPMGFLRMWGVLDFAGGTVVHMSSGFSALAGAIVIGRRRVHLEKKKRRPANIPYVILGTGLLWFGWFGFNSGSALNAGPIAVRAFVTTNTATAMAMVTWMVFDCALGRKPTASGACTGALVGLVGITPACGFVSVQRSIFIGFAAAVICNLACTLRKKTPLDDTLDVFACHGVGGTVGLLCTGFFADDVGVVSTQGRTFGYHWLAFVIVAAYSFVVSAILFFLVGLICPMRVNCRKEELGLDITQHGERAYDFDELLDNTIHSSSCCCPAGLDASRYDAPARMGGLLPVVEAPCCAPLVGPSVVASLVGTPMMEGASVPAAFPEHLTIPAFLEPSVAIAVTPTPTELGYTPACTPLNFPAV